MKFSATSTDTQISIIFSQLPVLKMVEKFLSELSGKVKIKLSLCYFLDLTN